MDENGRSNSQRNTSESSLVFCSWGASQLYDWSHPIEGNEIGLETSAIATLYNSTLLFLLRFPNETVSIDLASWFSFFYEDSLQFRHPGRNEIGTRFKKLPSFYRIDPGPFQAESILFLLQTSKRIGLAENGMRRLEYRQRGRRTVIRSFLRCLAPQNERECQTDIEWSSKRRRTALDRKWDSRK